MRQSIIAKLRERKTNATTISATTRIYNTIRSRSKSDVAFQLDYYMSPQFGGIAAALVDGLYDGMNVSFLPICPVGLEPARVRNHQNENPTTICVGSVEQNIFIPTLYQHPDLRLKGVASMFRRSPLCIASFQQDVKTIGCHEDTVSLLQRIFPHADIVASPRGTKITDVMDGTYDGIQAYTTTEVPTMIRQPGHDAVVVTPLEELNGTKLGYSQMLFASEESLEDDRREVVSAFLHATFRGWESVIRDPQGGIDKVREARKMLRLDDENNDHWYGSADFEVEMLQRCNDYVKETFEGDRLGVINGVRWNEATRWLLDDATLESGFGLDTTLWRPAGNLLPGNELARTIMEGARKSASEFYSRYGRKPSLAVITVGQLDRYTHAERRLQLYSNSSNSWFAKTKAGASNGFAVEEINLNAATTTDELLSVIYSLKDVDGIQLMWPLPDHIDPSTVYNAIELEKDVDGIHYVGQREIMNTSALPPVAAAGTLALMKQHNVELRNKAVLVIGRSPIVGSPIAQMLREEGAIVTVAHSEVDADRLEALVRKSDVILSCAGLPRLIKAEWVEGGIVINVGTTFVGETDSLHPDFEGDLNLHASRFSPVPGGVGPLSTPMLFQNLADAAWKRMECKGSVLETWDQEPAKLKKTFHFASYSDGIEFLNKVGVMSSIMDHHANVRLVHKCVDGVDIELQFFSFEAQDLISKDFEAAKAIDTVSVGGEIKMKDFSYDLDEGSIAKYPANPRGSSKMLFVDGRGELHFFRNFSESFPAIAKDAFVVFNDSHVLDARLFVKASGGEDKMEMMILDMGEIDATEPAKDIVLNVMLRSESVQPGDLLWLKEDTQIEVMDVKGVWQEDAKSNGNGVEAFVRILSDEPLSAVLEAVGTVPIPPYFQRTAEESDKESYNTVYSDDRGGSVAAPTAGLHFTKEVLEEIGPDNVSFLSLHVGAGTFQPVMKEDARDHQMHLESFSVRVAEIKRIVEALRAGKSLMSVGTTSSRTLETLFWCGVKKLKGFQASARNLHLDQFEWVPLSVGDSRHISPITALEALVNGLDESEQLSGRTGLMITPTSYKFKVVDHLVTNFHAPDSTLMLLVSAFLGADKIKTVYKTAQAKGYRFLSYGDVCVFSKPGSSDLDVNGTN